MAAQLQKTENELADARELVLVDDPEMAAEAVREVEQLEASVADLEARLKPALLPHDPLDDRNAIIEIRAGTGGDEAALFAADIYRVYTRFIERAGWRRTQGAAPFTRSRPCATPQWRRHRGRAENT